MLKNRQRGRNHGCHEGVSKLTQASAGVASPANLQWQAAGAVVDLTANAVNLVRIAGINKKKHKLEIGANFAQQACVFFQASKADPFYGCTKAGRATLDFVRNIEKVNRENVAKASCGESPTGPITTAMMALPVGRRPDSDPHFAEKLEALNQLAESTRKAYLEKLEQDSSALKNLGAKARIESIFGSIETKINICMSTSGIWTREERRKNRIGSMCQKLLACYPSRPRPGQDGKLENKSCEMMADRDDYLARLKMILKFEGSGMIDSERWSFGPTEEEKQQMTDQKIRKAYAHARRENGK